MTKEQYSKATILIDHINDISADIKALELLVPDSHGLFVMQNGYYKPILAKEDRINQFLCIVLQDMRNEKAKLEKELEEL